MPDTARVAGVIPFRRVGLRGSDAGEVPHSAVVVERLALTGGGRPVNVRSRPE